MLKNIKVLWAIIVIQTIVILVISGLVEVKVNLPMLNQAVESPVSNN